MDNVSAYAAPTIFASVGIQTQAITFFENFGGYKKIPEVELFQLRAKSARCDKLENPALLATSAQLEKYETFICHKKFVGSKKARCFLDLQCQLLKSYQRTLSTQPPPDVHGIPLQV
jgi:hypothetical protein